jgi:hypothetical protein
VPLKSDRLCCRRGLWFDSARLAIHETSGAVSCANRQRKKIYK